MRVLAAAFLTLGALCAIGYAATQPSAGDLVITRGAMQTTQPGPSENFTGSARISTRFRGVSPSRVTGSVVSFEPGARTNWHTHPVGQTLIVLSGSGWVQREGAPKQAIKAGDFVWTPPGVKHWHGAASDSPMSHVAIVEELDGKAADWLERVTDEQYGEARSKGTE